MKTRIRAYSRDYELWLSCLLDIKCGYCRAREELQRNRNYDIASMMAGHIPKYTFKLKEQPKRPYTINPTTGLVTYY